MLIIVLYAQGTRQKSYGPILNLPILTDTDSNRFLRILTLPIPIPILIHKYHTDTDTDFLKNTDIPIPIPIIPIIGPSLNPTYTNTFLFLGTPMFMIGLAVGTKLLA